jgi:site-specific DNA recombinase
VTTTQPVVRAYARISVFSEVSQQIDQAKYLIGKWAAFKNPDRDVVWYIDEAVSGARPMANRPAGRRLLRELRSGDVLAVTKIDRAARNVADLLDTLQHVEEVGASFVATEQDLSTEGAYGRFTVVLLGAVAELERSIMAERQRAAREQLHRDGRHVGRVHFGFEAVPNPDGKGLVVRPHPVDGPRLREAVLAVLSGRSMASQARKLGISRPGMQRLMRSPRLIGRTPIAVTGGWRVDPDVPADPEAALISVSDWNRLRAMLDRDEPRSMTRTGGYGEALECWRCGGRLYLDIDSGSGGSYRCHGHPGAPTIARAVADDFLEGWFLGFYGGASMYEIERDEDDSDRTERLAEVELGIRETAQAQTRPGADVLALAQRVVELHAERAAIEAEPAGGELRVVATGENMTQHWHRSSDAERVAMMQQAMRVIVHPARPSRRGGRLEVIEPEWPEGTVKVLRERFDDELADGFGARFES